VTSLDRHATELRGLVNDFMSHFRAADGAAVNGPHATLSCHELSIVERLGDGGPAMMRQLAEHLNLAANTVTTLIDQMEARGLVRRQRSEEDRRVVKVELTEAGRVSYKGAVTEMLSALRAMLKALDPGEQETFLGLFRKIARGGAAGK
jgi:DNA-binding MarR family transcriptional regulator